MNPVLLTGYMLFIGSFVLFVMGLMIEPSVLASLSNTKFLYMGDFLILSDFRNRSWPYGL